MSSALELYGFALSSTRPLVVRAGDGSSETAALERWLGSPTAADERVLDRAMGPVLDVGCGPGRLVGALIRRGDIALGVDVSPEAIAVARGRGAVALATSIFAEIPGTGRWRCALLLDGNIGIGARPRALLARLATLLAPRGEILAELEPPGSDVCTVLLRVELGGSASDWFKWARVGVDAIESVAAQAGLAVTELWCDGGRWFTRLRRL